MLMCLDCVTIPLIWSYEIEVLLLRTGSLFLRMARDYRQWFLWQGHNSHAVMIAHNAILICCKACTFTIISGNCIVIANSKTHHLQKTFWPYLKWSLYFFFFLATNQSLLNVCLFHIFSVCFGVELPGTIWFLLLSDVIEPSLLGCTSVSLMSTWLPVNDGIRLQSGLGHLSNC